MSTPADPSDERAAEEFENGQGSLVDPVGKPYLAKEQEVEQFLLAGLPAARDEPGTIAWFGLRLGSSTFGIFDAFPDDAGWQAHLSGKVAAALMAESIRPAITSSEHREGRRVGGETAGMRSTP